MGVLSAFGAGAVHVRTAEYDPGIVVVMPGTFWGVVASGITVALVASAEEPAELMAITVTR
jgi:hypothetical protein